MEDKKETRLAVNGRLVRRKYNYSPEALARREERKLLRLQQKASKSPANSAAVINNITKNVMNQVQSIKLSKGLINSINDAGDRININFSPITVIQNNDGPYKPVSDYKYHALEDQMWSIIESLPNPKLDNLRKFAIRTCLNKFGQMHSPITKLAKYLDFQRTYVSRLNSELRNDELFGAGTIDVEPLNE